ncbi:MULTISPECIES: hypothetical protein [unclassified Thermococcus]|uniref:hypothetical protein n=1 Tax=unclassified Thermococcus TaxID=2627626 RepID=UPI00142F97BA|nr:MULTISPECIES: hypothetical protein [unclassified Thermococcus]
MTLTFAQIREEVKYTAKHIGLNLISIPWVTATIYWLSSLLPVSSGTIVGLPASHSP